MTTFQEFNFYRNKERIANRDMVICCIAAIISVVCMVIFRDYDYSLVGIISSPVFIFTALYFSGKENMATVYKNCAKRKYEREEKEWEELCAKRLGTDYEEHF